MSRTQWDLTDLYYEQEPVDDLVRDLPPVTSIGFTGTSGTVGLVHLSIVDRLLTAFRAQRDGQVEFHHGDCVGSDENAATLARRRGLWIVGHPPTNPYKRAWVECDELRPEDDYLVRNGHIIAESDVLIATPKETAEELRSGTWATVRRGRKAGIPIILVTPREVRLELPEQASLL